MENIKLGTDPEMFLEKNGEVVSAEGLLGGTKQSPREISEDGHAVQEDNIMVEFNIPACSDAEAFVDNINFVKSYLTTFAAMHDCTLSTRASALVDRRHLKTRQAREFGCDPDYNVHTQDVNPSVNNKTNLRTCGGHIHIGYDNPNQETSEKIIRAMDMILGLESLMLDKDDQRRQMYGKAGAFRFKRYGVEYRTLSNFWIMSDDLMKWAFNKTMEAVELVKSGKIDRLYEDFGSYTREAIDSNNKELAQRIIEKIKETKLTTV